MPEAPVLMVGTDPQVVESDLVGGLMACPLCRGVLGPWGHGRWRVLRRRSGAEDRRRPRRAMCRGCGKTQVLLGVDGLVRRRDEVAVIGEAIEANVAGEGFRPIAARLGAYPETVRGWLRRFAERAEEIRAHFTRCAVALDPELGPVMPAGGGVADALEAIAITARAWVLRFGPGEPGGPWEIASRFSGGRLLGNTNRPLESVS